MIFKCILLNCEWWYLLKIRMILFMKILCFGFFFIKIESFWMVVIMIFELGFFNCFFKIDVFELEFVVFFLNLLYFFIVW